jgi:transposase
MWEAGSQVALEAIGSWYWIVDEIEVAGFIPRLVHPRKAKLMLGMINKTDKLDAKRLKPTTAINTLPTVWIPPALLRDKHQLCRTRLVLTRGRTQVKCRIHSLIEKYGFQDEFKQLSDSSASRAAKNLNR